MTKTENGFFFPEAEEEVLKAEERRREEFVLSLPRFDSPRNDNEELLNLQFLYLAENDKKAFSRLWEKSLLVALKIIRLELKKTGMFLNSDEVEDKKTEAVEYVLLRYNKRYKSGDFPWWAARKNFVSELYGGCLHALYYEEQLRRNAERRRNARKDKWAGDLFGG